MDNAESNFVAVGSGANGTPLASNLARTGYRVLLLKAGTGHRCVFYDG